LFNLADMPTLALPGIGHACGHNLIAICGVGVALAIRDALVHFEVPGKVVLLGTPGILIATSLPSIGDFEIIQLRKVEVGN
jgi:hypothetical protein